MEPENAIIAPETIERAILLIRGEKVLLDRDLANLYDVSTSVLNKAVTRNIDRFPSDFMFQLTKEEFSDLKFHFGTSNWGGTRKLPRAFTEQGVVMLCKTKERNYRSMNKYVREGLSARQLRIRLTQIIHAHFQPKKFTIKSKTIDIGSFFETGIDLHWFLISKRGELSLRNIMIDWPF